MKDIKYKSVAKTAVDLLNMNQGEYPTLLKGIIPLKGIATLAGSSDLGKSYLLEQFAVAVSSNQPSFLGFDLNIKKPAALYISTEDDDFAMADRLKYLKTKASDEGLKNLRFIFDSGDLQNVIDNELALNPVSLVVIDAFGDVFRGSINDSISVRSFLDPFKALAQKHECAIIINHHCGKNNHFKIPSKDNLLGSQGFESSMRVVLELRMDLTRNTIRHLCIVKGNNMGDQHKTKSIELNFDFQNGFENTGQRIPFNKLFVSKSISGDTALTEKVFEMKKQGKTVRAIANELSELGMPVSKSTVGEMIKTRPMGNPKIKNVN